MLTMADAGHGISAKPSAVVSLTGLACFWFILAGGTILIGLGVLIATT
jgi:hypothetical protein